VISNPAIRGGEFVQHFVADSSMTIAHPYVD